jgi:hypothetical protein
VAGVFTLAAHELGAQSQYEARNRWERLCTIRREKFDRILPEAMRENGIDMWIVAMKEGHYDPLWELLGRGYVGSIGYYIFTDRGGDRIERVSIGITDHHRSACGAYDSDSTIALGQFVSARSPRRIGLNMSEEMGLADGLSGLDLRGRLRPGALPGRIRLDRGDAVPMTAQSMAIDVSEEMP